MLDLLHTQGLSPTELAALDAALNGYDCPEFVVWCWCPSPGLQPLQFDPPCRGFWIATDINRWVYKIHSTGRKRWTATLSTDDGDMELTPRASFEAAVLGCEAHRRQLRIIGTGTVARHLLRSGSGGS
ncbi:hypothetical protein [Mycobacterium sp. HM-7]